MDTDRTRTLSRALRLTQIVGEISPMPRKLAEIAEAADLPRATTHRLLHALVAEGMLTNGPEGYVLGPLCWSLGRAAERRYDITPIVRPSIARIAEETGDVGLFSVRIGDHTRVIARAEGDHPVLPTSLREGSERPLGVGGHALAQLAALPDGEIAQILSRTAEERDGAFPICTTEFLLEKVITARAAGYALASSEIVSGWEGIALVVRDAWGQVLGAISFAAISERLPESRRPAILALLTQERDRIQASLQSHRPQ